MLNNLFGVMMHVEMHKSWWLLIQFHFRLKQRWIEVTTETQADELINAVNQGFKSKATECRTMVFANTVEAAEAVAIYCWKLAFNVTVTIRMSPWRNVPRAQLISKRKVVFLCALMLLHVVLTYQMSHMLFSCISFYEISYSSIMYLVRFSQDWKPC